MAPIQFVMQRGDGKQQHKTLVGSNNSDEEVESYKDNPVFLALEKVKMRQQTSLDSDSRAASRTSHIRQQLEIYCNYILIVMPLLELC